MATTSLSDDRGGRGVILLLFLAIIIIFAVSIGIGSLSDLPMTRHAAQGRVDTTMDAETIRQMIDNRACKPIEVHVCPPANLSKLMCYLKPADNGDSLWAGVLVGINPPHPIITGYTALYLEYWAPANVRDGCWLASRIG